MKKERDSGIELLRILAILMVICVHAFVYGNYYDEALSVDGLVASSAVFIEMGVRACVNIFVIITGYFMINSQFDLKKSYARLLRFYGQVWFYSVGLTILSLASGISPDEKIATTILKGIFPISGQQWYFLTDYFLLCLLVPFINLCLKQLTKKQYQVLLGVLISVLSIWLVLAQVYPFNLWVSYYGYEGIDAGKNVFSFMFIYIIGAYVSRFWNKRNKPNLGYLLGAIACVGINYMLFTTFANWVNYRDVSMIYMNPFVIGVALFLLLFFKDLHFHNRFINLLGGTTLGIYAIHEFKYVRSNVVWDIFDFSQYNNNNVVVNILRIIGVILAVFFLCAAIELLRQIVTNLIRFKVIEKYKQIKKEKV